MDHAEIRAKKPINDHFTISFPFLIRSSSQPDTVIKNAPYTTAPTARSHSSPQSAVVQDKSFCFTHDSMRAFPGSTRSVSLKQLSRAVQIDEFNQKSQSAAKAISHEKIPKSMRIYK